MEIKRQEIYRYLGYGSGRPDDRIRAEVGECAEMVERVMSPRSFYRTFPLTSAGDGIIDFTCFQVKSESLDKNLAGCCEVILFAATLGAEVDLLIRRYSCIAMSRAVILQAVGAAAIEAYCDQENGILKESYSKKGYCLRPRFSPGYGDFPLSAQKELTEALEAEKRVGITLTDSFLMVPSKSVTAVIGVGGQSNGCEITGCGACGRKECLYRRG